MSLTIIPVVLIAAIIAGVVLCFTKFDRPGKILVTTGVTAGAVLLNFLGGLILMLSTKRAPTYIVLMVAATLLILALLIYLMWVKEKKKIVLVLLYIALALLIVFGVSYYSYGRYVDSIPTVEITNDVLWKYRPYNKDTKVAELDGESTLKIEENVPVMDGATALYPIYSAFAKAVYPREFVDGNYDYLTCTTTTDAYNRIVTGEVDIIFVGGPSEEQKKFAEEQGVELEYTPIGREAFVFFVNSQNPLENITVEQIKKVYSGEMTEWSELGVEKFGKIRAFQRDEGSGSQSALERLMGDTPLMPPLKENVMVGMGTIISKAADYKNYKNAIGYSFRFYSNEMIGNNQIKLLDIEGITPSIENIENGTYPIASEFFAVTRKNKTENTEKLLDWIVGKQGQELVEKTGYTSIK